MQSGWRIAIVPKNLAGVQKTYDALNAIASIDHDRFFASADKADDPYEEIAFRLPDDAAAKIRALKLPGVLLVQDQWRNYPGGDLASQVIGFVAYKGDTKTGVYGLERQWQPTLAVTSTGTYVNPFAEIFANVSAALSPKVTDQEGSIVTTIEPTVQAHLESTLDDVVKTYSPRLVGGIVMNPHTGEIVAMATRPDFDPNTYNTVTNPAVYSNQLVEGRYELGSIMKALTMAAGIDAGAVTPQTTYNDTGCLELSGKKVCNYDFKARGVIPMQEVLNQSLNVGATFVQERMGQQTFTQYMRNYGFDTKTGIDLPNEVTGSLATLGNGSGPDVNFSTASFGQGVSVSPIEMIRALASLANDGVLPTPHVVKAIQLVSGITRTVPVAPGVRVLSATTTDTITNMLSTVFDKALLNGDLKKEHYSIAAKTGTAQIAIPGQGYYPDRYLHSFFGYFPAHDPKFIIFLFAVEPHGVEYASASLAHPFDTLATFLLNYYDISPDR
jgi:cell division protein FtsI/penicillin-binding protein 2